MEFASGTRRSLGLDSNGNLYISDSPSAASLVAIVHLPVTIHPPPHLGSIQDGPIPPPPLFMALALSWVYP